MKKQQKQRCSHCGLTFHYKPIYFESQVFCCHGCETVYQLLKSVNLETYYDIAPTPGHIPTKQVSDYAELDTDAIKRKWVTFNEGSVEHASLSIPGIHCSACIWILEQLDRLVKGVHHSTVDFPNKTLHVAYDLKHTSLRAIATRLNEIGYPPLISLEPATKSLKANRKLWTQLGISGFAFGNSMFLSLPGYFEQQELWLERLQPLLDGLQLLMSIPVVVFAAQDYFKTAWKGLKMKILSLDVPIALGITVLFLSSCYTVLFKGEAGYFDSLAGLVFFLLIGKYIQGQTYKAFSFDRDYQSFFPMGVLQVQENGTQNMVPVGSVQKDDILHLKHAELIPTDAVLLSDTSLIDYSFVTGESKPVQKVKGDPVYAGGRIHGGTCRIRAFKKVAQSRLIQLWDQEAFRKDDKTHFKNLNSQLSRIFTPVILAIALLSGLFWGFKDISRVVEIMTAVLIVACPCALALSGPFVLGNMIRYFGRWGFYIKNTEIIEKLAVVDHIVFDKTGTLTESRPDGIHFEGEALTPRERMLIAAVAHTSSHPLSQALFQFLAPKNTRKETLPEPETQHDTGFGIRAYAGGKTIVFGSQALVKSAPELPLVPDSIVHLSIDEHYRGYFQIPQLLRPGLKPMLDAVNTYPLSLLSGDGADEQQRLQALLPKNTCYRFAQNPFQKIEYIKKIQTQNKHVLMVGDGLNDAGALKQSNVGLAVASTSHAFTPACDAILAADKLPHFHHILWAAKQSIFLIKISFGLSFLYNCIGLSIAVAGFLSPVVAAVLMPLSSISIVIFAYCSTALLHTKFRKKTAV